MGGPHAEQRKPTLVQAIHELVRAGRGVGKDTQPCERIYALVHLHLVGRNGWLTNAARSVTAGNEVARHLVRLFPVAEANLGQAQIEISNAGVFDLEPQRLAGRDARANQILHHFVLPIDRDSAAAGQLRERNAMAVAAERHVNPFVPQAFAREPIADADLAHQIDGALLEHPRADALDHMLLAAVFEDERMDAAQAEQVAEHQPSRTGPDDADLRSNLVHYL